MLLTGPWMTRFAINCTLQIPTDFRNLSVSDGNTRQHQHNISAVVTGAWTDLLSGLVCVQIVWHGCVLLGFTAMAAMEQACSLNDATIIWQYTLLHSENRSASTVLQPTFGINIYDVHEIFQWNIPSGQNPNQQGTTWTQTSLRLSTGMLFILRHCLL